MSDPTAPRRRDKRSFMRELFAGRLPTDLVLPYPRLDADETENLDLLLDSFRKFADQKIDAAKFSRCLLGHGCGRVVASDVDRNESSAAAGIVDFLGNSLPLSFVDLGNDDMGPVLGQGFCVGFTDSLPRSGNDRHLIVELHVCSFGVASFAKS